MLILGPRLRLRPVRIIDWPLFVQCYEAWPGDAQGPYSVARALTDVDLCVAQTGRVTVPLTESSGWRQTLIVYTDEMPAGIGIHHGEAWGLAMVVLNQAFIPSIIGKGYFAELQQLLQRYAFTVLGAAGAGFRIFHASPAALAHVMNRPDKYVPLDDTVGEETKLPVRRGMITRAAWDAWQVAHPVEAAARFEYQP